MAPILDSMPLPGLATMVVTASPWLLVAGIALVATVAWLVAGAGEELRRIAARDFDARRTILPRPARSERAAA
jgi:hypothetical protein